MRLRRSVPSSVGIRRVRRGRGFSYEEADGVRVGDEEVLERIQALVIPPAWRKVWICPHPNGHIQAVGIDAAGRRQYLYHDQWRLERDEEKHDRVLEMASRLPALRSSVEGDLRKRGLGRARVEAVALRLLDRGVFRVGGEEYAEENNTRGVATLLREQVSLHGDEMLFDYIAKGGLRRRIRIEDATLAAAVRSLQRSKADTDRLLAYRAQAGDYRELHAADVNARFKELAGENCSAKDLRTWHGTVLAAAGLAAHADEAFERPKKIVTAVVKDVAQALGNTPTVARNSYIDPRVVTAFQDGRTIEAALRRSESCKSEDEKANVVDRAVVRLIRRS